MIRVALVHDWLTGTRGGEVVLEAIAELFPQAELFTLLYVPGTAPPPVMLLKRKTSWLQKVPQAEKRYRSFLPLMPRMIESLDLSGMDLIISSSHCVAKGVRKPPGSVHMSYVHAPMRYIWDRYEEYFGPGRASIPVRLAARVFRKRLQAWDRRVSQEDRIDQLLANSRFIAQQIRSAYGRESQVIYPFANLKRFEMERKPGRNYLMVTAFAPYKRVDIAVEAFNRLKLPLLVVGSGQDKDRLRKLAGPTVQFLGALSNSAVTDLYSKCRALIFPGVEDFGITPVEAMAAGAPVIAFEKGGVSETVTERTGVFFTQQTPESLMEAVIKLENGEVSFTETECRKRAAEFSRIRFQKELLGAISDTWVRSGKDRAELNPCFERLEWIENAKEA
jgi:glycosyltransferase involved in cell wall biosynthesis